MVDRASFSSMAYSAGICLDHICKLKSNLMFYISYGITIAKRKMCQQGLTILLKLINTRQKCLLKDSVGQVHLSLLNIRREQLIVLKKMLYFKFLYFK